MRSSLKVISLILVLLLVGCASSLMQPLDQNKVPYPSTPGKQSLVVFMRPSTFGGAIQSSVFDLSLDGSEEDRLVGIVSAKKKVAYLTNPGKHRFMVIGENADFMEADLLPGKTYYSAVTVRMGVWKARFSLRAMHHDELSSDLFTRWFNACSWVENTEMAHQWAQDNRSSIVHKRETYLVKWNARLLEPHKVLLPEDGI